MKSIKVVPVPRTIQISAPPIKEGHFELILSLFPSHQNSGREGWHCFLKY